MTVRLWSCHTKTFFLLRVFDARKGTACHEELLNGLLGGMNLQPPNQVFVIDVIPNRLDHMGPV